MSGWSVRQGNGNEIAELIVIIGEASPIAAVGLNDVAVNIIVKAEVISVAALNPSNLAKIRLRGVCAVSERVKIAAIVGPGQQIGPRLIKAPLLNVMYWNVRRLPSAP